MIFRKNFIRLSLLCTLWRNALATFCNICDYTKADSCEHRADYKLVDCESFWSASRYCLKLNGTRLAVRQNDGGEVKSSGVHRACQQDADLETFGLLDIQPGCRKVHVLNRNTSMYRQFVFDGELCVCQETGCNYAGRLIHSYINCYHLLHLPLSFLAGAVVLFIF